MDGAILIIGAGGQLGRDLQKFLPSERLRLVDHSQLDICDAAAVAALLEELRPACIFNTAAYNRVDDGEDQPAAAFGVNTVGVCHLARAAQRLGAVLVHFSTNYVFDGARNHPYVESDTPKPLSVYGLSKLAGEQVVQHYCERYFVIRTTGLYGVGGSRSKGDNFIETVLRLAGQGKPVPVVTHQIQTPTSTRDLAEKVYPLIQTGAYGLYHMTSTGQCTWEEFAREILRQAGLRAELRPVTWKELGARAARPPYSVLDNAALRCAGLPDFRLWQEALAGYLGERKRATTR